jgi:hypothetical protein
MYVCIVCTYVYIVGASKHDLASPRVCVQACLFSHKPRRKKKTHNALCVCVCVTAHMYVCSDMRARTHVCVFRHACAHTCMCVQTCVRAHMYVCSDITRTCLCKHAHVCVHMRARKHPDVCMHKHGRSLQLEDLAPAAATTAHALRPLPSCAAGVLAGFC